jgi:hypothetical protein
MFALMIDFINGNWVAYHITIGLFEALDTSRTTLVEYVKELKMRAQT